ncbi:hypothetical protein Tco_0942548 [Tanacetum coccineum]
MATFEILDQLTEVADSSRLQDRMKVWFVQKCAEEEAFAWFLCDQFACLRMSMSKDQRDSTKLGVLKQLLAGTHVRLGGLEALEQSLGISYAAGVASVLQLNDIVLGWTRPSTKTGERGGVLRFKGVIAGTVYHDLYLSGIALVERENVGFDLARPLP